MIKIKTLLIILFLLISALTIAYIDYGIRNYDLQFYSGKDGGYILRFESIVILSTIFYLLNAIHPNRKLIDYFGYLFAGFFVGIIIGFGCYILLPLNDSGLSYHLVSIVVCYISLYIIRRLKRLKSKKASAE